MKALITGGNTGLGKSVADKLSAIGFDVKILTTEKLKDAVSLHCIKSYIDSELGGDKFDIIINNFGINHLSWIGDTPQVDENILMANVMVAYWIINNQVDNGAVARVVNVSSQTYRVAQRTTTLYCASKAAVVQMSKVMARELAPKGWVVNVFAPGKIEGTDMSTITDQQVIELRGWNKETSDAYASMLIPMGRFMDVNEASDIIMKIIEMPDYVNGAVIEAFGGL